jgi:leucyl/phenylalanyl-tRNA--protein transferase
LRRIINSGRFEVTFDKDFQAVISACSAVSRPGQNGTWLVPEMIRAYARLHELGFAHSVEAWLGGKLCGGLYGVALGKMFFGESMFFREDNASKVAFVHMVGYLKEQGFVLIDCQQTTPHMMRFGAREIPRSRFLAILRKYAARPWPVGHWLQKIEYS